MLKQYSILNKCLSELKQSDLPVIEKLKLEVQLIQTKRLLLDHKIEHRITGEPGSEREFNQLYEQVHQACANHGPERGVEQVKVMIRDIKNGLHEEPGNDFPLRLAK